MLFRRIKSHHAAVLLNLCFILILGNVLFLVGIDRTEPEVSIDDSQNLKLYKEKIITVLHKSYYYNTQVYFFLNLDIVYSYCCWTTLHLVSGLFHNVS